MEGSLASPSLQREQLAKGVPYSLLCRFQEIRGDHQEPVSAGETVGSGGQWGHWRGQQCP